MLAFSLNQSLGGRGLASGITNSNFLYTVTGCPGEITDFSVIQGRFGDIQEEGIKEARTRNHTFKKIFHEIGLKTIRTSGHRFPFSRKKKKKRLP